MMIETVAILMALISLLFSSCTIRVNNETNKPKSTKQFDLKDFNKIHISGNAEIEFIQDSIYKVEVTTTDKGFEILNLEVKDNTLHMDYNDKGRIIINNGPSYKLTVTAPDLQDVTVSGACKLKVQKITTSEFSITTSGASEIDIKNLTAEKVSFSTSGASDIKAHLADCGDVEVQVSGAGNVKLTGNAHSINESTSGVTAIDTKGLKIE